MRTKAEVRRWRALCARAFDPVDNHPTRRHSLLLMEARLIHEKNGRMRSPPAARESDGSFELRPVLRSELVAGRYRILATLGRGGMADVYLGAATGPAGFNKLVVVKKLRNGSEDPSLVEMARSFGAGEFALFGRVYLPSALPAVMLGLRLGVVQAVKGMVVGEMLISLVGLGERLIYYGNTFLIAELYAVIASVLLIALATSQLAQALDRALIRWK